MTAAAAKDGELRRFDTLGAFLETSADEETYDQDSRGISGVPEDMTVLNKTYGLVQAGRGLFNMICDDKFE